MLRNLDCGRIHENSPNSAWFLSFAAVAGMLPDTPLIGNAVQTTVKFG